MRDTQHTFLPDNLISTSAGPRLTFYEVCLTSDNTALAGQHTGEIADLGEAFASIFERCRSSKSPTLSEPRGPSTMSRL
jgi:hypothetical protein